MKKAQKMLLNLVQFTKNYNDNIQESAQNKWSYCYFFPQKRMEWEVVQAGDRHDKFKKFILLNLWANQ